MVYIWVVDKELCPNSSCIVLRSPLDSSIWVAKLCLNMCGWIAGSPCFNANLFSLNCMLLTVNLEPFKLINRALDSSENFDLSKTQFFMAAFAYLPIPWAIDPTRGLCHINPFDQTLDQHFSQFLNPELLNHLPDIQLFSFWAEKHFFESSLEDLRLLKFPSIWIRYWWSCHSF